MTGSKTLAVARYEIRKTVRRKAFMFVAVVIPLILVLGVFIALPVLPGLLSGLGSAVGISDKPVGFVDTLGFLNSSGNMIEFADEKSARDALDAGNISGYFIPDASYFRSGNVTYYLAGTMRFDFFQSGVEGFMRSAVMKHYGIPESEAGLIMAPFRPSFVKISEGGAISGSNQFLEFGLPYGFALFLLIAILFSSSYLMQGIGEEKENKTGELLLSSISADQLLRGKIIGYGAVGLMQTSAYIAAALLVIFFSPFAAMFAGMQITGIFAIGIVYSILGYGLFAVSIAATASVSSSAKEAQQTSGFFTIFGVIPIMFITLIVQQPNSALAQALTLIPYTSPFVMVMRMTLTSVPLVEVAASLLIILVTIAVVSKAAARIFRMGMLKYDRRASLREVLGFIRHK